jgi:hypothetical protein
LSLVPEVEVEAEAAAAAEAEMEEVAAAGAANYSEQARIGRLPKGIYFDQQRILSRPQVEEHVRHERIFPAGRGNPGAERRHRRARPGAESDDAADRFRLRSSSAYFGFDALA